MLDGVTFGAASAVMFAGAELLTHSSTFLAAGLQPAGLVTPWTLRLLTLGFAVPILAAASVGSATGALWLRYRAPQADRGKLALLGHPLFAVVLAAVLLVSGALVQLYLGRWAALAALVGLDVLALLWLRQLIHLGLLEEAAEIEVGPPRRCPNCGRETPWHSFCAYCGVSLRALPKSGRPHQRHGRARLLAGFPESSGGSLRPMVRGEGAGRIRGSNNPWRIRGVRMMRTAFRKNCGRVVGLLAA